MTNRMRVLVSLACSGAIAAVPASAQAARFVGMTKQHRPVVVRTGATGKVKRLDIAFSARCGTGAFVSQGAFIPPFDLSVPGRLRDGSPPVVRVRLSGHRHAIVRAYVRAHRTAGGNWRGTYRVDAAIFRRHTRINSCHLHHDTWRAARVSAVPPFTG